MTQLLATVFAKIGQPRVIAEVVAGIILGPTVMGRIPSMYGLAPGSQSDCSSRLQTFRAPFSPPSRCRT